MLRDLARSLRDSVIAGLCGTAAQFVLMTGRKALGILPQFQPYEDMQRLLLSSFGTSTPPVLHWLLPFISGALIWSSIFSWAYRWIPGETAPAKGLSVTVFAWLLTGLVIFPLIGQGLFAFKANAGFWPALLMLVMLSAYCLTLSLVYGRLKQG